MAGSGWYKRVLRSVPISWWLPMRLAAARRPHGHVLRRASILVLKRVAASNRGVLPEKVREIRPLDAPGITFSSADSMVLDDLFWFGTRGYEGALPQLWARLCAQASDIVEIGGNVGLYTILGGKATTGSYTVVEPVPHVAAALRANLARNGLFRIRQLDAAAIPGPEERRVCLSIPDEKREIPVGSHLLKDIELATRSSAQVIEVVGMPFRGLVGGCDLVKIDAEGIEAALLEDTIDILLTAKPTLVVEVLPESTRLSHILKRLAQEGGYCMYVVPGWGRRPIVSVRSHTFTADLPSRLHSKDVVLTRTPLEEAVAEPTSRS